MSSLIEKLAVHGNVLDELSGVDERARIAMAEYLTYKAGDGRYMRKVEPGGLIPVLNVQTLFGAVGDGVADDTDVLESALALEGRVYAPEGTYLLSSALTPDADVWLEGDGVGKTILSLSSAVAAITASNPSVASTTLDAGAELYDETIEVAAATGIEVGDLLILSSDALWYYDNRGTLVKGEQHRVRSVSGTTITLTEPVMDNYDISGGETVTVTVYRPRRFVLRNLSIRYDSPTSAGAMSANRYVDVVVENVEILNAQNSGMAINNCHGARISGAHLDLKTGDGSTVGYGIQVNASYGIMISDSLLTNVQRGIDFSGSNGVSRFCAVSNCVAHSEERSSTGHSGFGTHGTAEGIEFNGCLAHGFRDGFLIRGANCSINGGHIMSRGQGAAITVDHGSDVIINGVAYSDMANGRTQLTTSLGSLSVPTFILVGSDFQGELHVTGCKTRGILTRIFRLAGDLSGLHCVGNNFNIRNNIGGTSVYLFDASSAVTISESVIRENRYTVTTGTKNIFHSNVTVQLDSCSFDNVIITDTSRLTVWSGAGSLANVVVDVHVARIDEHYAHVIGRLEFDVTGGTALIRLNNLPTAAYDQLFSYVREDHTTARLRFVSASNDLYISEDEAGYNTAFPIGTGYVVDFDVRYRVA